MDIEEWLRSLGLQQYGTAFRENNVEAEVLLRLTAEDLKDIRRQFGRAPPEASGGYRRAAGKFLCNLS
ncbi:SAM domain-containing protein [Mesorhizobium sp.]|uniref:SAM domain-containing protein n=1 Tax=Mesorhizobium sp. TaxID=1871066 RepID=UPI0025EAA845|nr:SAM domain-containing protein [Mesorhizobium sp.]